MKYGMLARTLVIALLGLITACSSDSSQTIPSSPQPAQILPLATEKSASNNLTHIEITLGDAKTLATLYSYPNAKGSSETLEKTIEHYLSQRLTRDQIDNGSVSVSIDEKGTYRATLTGSSSDIINYKPQIKGFLSSGLKASAAVEQLKKKGLWDEQDWRFFLPLGLSIVNQRSVQLLHFPPDYSLPNQNYLDSKTSQRWEKLLQLNGVPPSEVTLYESILDVAPIAAPASAGSTLSSTYRYFEPYVVDMLPLLLDIDEGSTTALPIVAYGGPVRSWVKDHYKLSTFGVNSFNTVQITAQVQAPILGANHPSYLWYAKENGRDAAMKVMQQDLISACWQARMGSNPSANGTSTLSHCSSYWANKPMTVCINMEIQAFDQSDSEAKASCKKSLPLVTTPHSTASAHQL